MSTRSIVCYERKSGKIVSSYVHYDGYVTGVGMELLESHTLSHPPELWRTTDHSRHLEKVTEGTTLMSSVESVSCLTGWRRRPTMVGLFMTLSSPISGRTESGLLLTCVENTDETSNT